MLELLVFSLVREREHITMLRENAGGIYGVGFQKGKAPMTVMRKNIKDE
jgi:hypothetical protein